MPKSGTTGTGSSADSHKDGVLLDGAEALVREKRADDAWASPTDSWSITGDSPTHHSRVGSRQVSPLVAGEQEPDDAAWVREEEVTDVKAAMGTDSSGLIPPQECWAMWRDLCPRCFAKREVLEYIWRDLDNWAFRDLVGAVRRAGYGRFASLIGDWAELERDPTQSYVPTSRAAGDGPRRW